MRARHHRDTPVRTPVSPPSLSRSIQIIVPVRNKRATAAIMSVAGLKKQFHKATQVGPLYRNGQLWQGTHRLIYCPFIPSPWISRASIFYLWIIYSSPVLLLQGCVAPKLLIYSPHTHSHPSLAMHMLLFDVKTGGAGGGGGVISPLPFRWHSAQGRRGRESQSAWHPLARTYNAQVVALNQGGFKSVLASVGTPLCNR